MTYAQYLANHGITDDELELLKEYSEAGNQIAAELLRRIENQDDFKEGEISGYYARMDEGDESLKNPDESGISKEARMLRLINEPDWDTYQRDVAQLQQLVDDGTMTAEQAFPPSGKPMTQEEFEKFIDEEDNS